MDRSRWLVLAVLIGGVSVAGAGAPQNTHQEGPTSGATYRVRTWPLPDNHTGDVSMDYIAYDPTTNAVWVPGGNSAAVDVVDADTGHVRQIAGLPTSQVPFRGGTRVLGPSAVSIGDGV